MSEWPGDGSVVTAEQVAQLDINNRSWGKELRTAAAELVNQRLANRISREDYTVRRSRGKADAGEHQRRAAVLASKLVRTF
ncbi:hypothetical protein [Paludibaculum fermentans]|uniref:Uncharacterized protein n=1 Tax=Paludibaculum fermentans TaxID=1473598 RepID=A0A7S7SLE2_PALFE|nr:hypothetical protein [Paludibaculum fermentans]QOY88341.1 hypothetical protein IRI77_37365 [Paludibaculum fermentans]